MTDLLRTIQALMMDPNAMTRLYAIDLLVQNHHRLDADTVVEILQGATNDREDEVVKHAKLSMSKLVEWGFSGEARLRELGIHSRMSSLSEIEKGREAELRRAAADVLAPVLTAVRSLVPASPVAAQALPVLGMMQDPGSVGLLVDSLRDPSLRDKAFEALQSFRTPEILSLVTRLVEREKDDAMLARSADVLGELEEPSALDTLLKLGASESEQVRERVALALGKLPRRAGEAPLIAFLEKEKAAPVLLAILSSLGRAGREAAVEAIGKRLGALSDDKVLSKAMMALGQIRSAKALPVLSRALASPHARVRANAVEAISRLPVAAKDVLPVLEPFLGDKNNRVRGNAIMAIFPHDHKRALEELRKMMKSDKTADRATAAWIASEIQNVEAVEALVVLTNTELDKNVQGSCLGALGRIRNPRVRAVLQRLLSHPNPQVKLAALSAYGRIGGPAVLKELEGIFQQTDNELLRAAIVSAMGGLSHQGNLTFLQRKLGNASERVVANAIAALDNVGGLEAAVMVQPFTGHANPRIRANAILVLWNLGQLQEATGLVRLLGGRDEAAVRAGLFATEEIARGLSWRELEKRPLLLAALRERVKELPAKEDPNAVTISFSSEPTEADGSSEQELALAGALRALAEAREDAALEAVKDVLARDRTCAPAHFLMSRLTANAEDRHEIPDEVAGGARFLYLLSEQLRAAKSIGDAEAVLSGYFRIFGLHLEMLSRFVEHGQQYLERKDLTGAGSIARFVVGQLQWTEDLHRRLGMVHLAGKQYAEAYGELWKACLNTPHEPGALLELARAAAGIGKRRLARALAETVLAMGGVDARVADKASRFVERLGSS